MYDPKEVASSIETAHTQKKFWVARGSIKH